MISIHFNGEVLKLDNPWLLSNIKEFFEPLLATEMQIHYYSYRLVDNKRGKIKID